MPSNLDGAVSRREISSYLEESRKADQFYIADKIMPAQKVAARAGRFPRFYRESGELLKAGADLRGVTGSFPEISRKHEWDNYQCEERGITERIDDGVAKEMSSFFSQERITAKLIYRYMQLNREQRVANIVQDTSTFNTTALTTALTEVNIGTIDFAKDLLEAQERLQRKALVANTLIMTQPVWNRISRTTKLQNYLYGPTGAGTGNRKIELSHVGGSFRIQNVMIAAATIDTAIKGQSASLNNVWSNDYIALANVETGDFASGGVGRTLCWKADSPGGIFTTDSWYDKERLGTILRVRTNSIEKILDTDSVELLSTNYA
jgi:hypothetical protein